MLLPAPPLYPRKPRKPKVPAAAAPVALALVSVTIDFFDPTDGEVRLVFNTSPDNPIGEVTEAFASKWTARYGGVLYEGSGIVNDGTFDGLLLHFSVLGASPGPDVINYSNDPSDVGDASGRMLGAFSGFPL